LGGRPSTRVKLSNALRFANTPLPCFVVLFVYGRNDAPDIYVAHFWHDLDWPNSGGGAALGGGGDSALHKRHLPIAFTAGDHVTDPLGHILEETGSPGSYGARKALILGRTGFEDGLGVASITFAPAVTPERFVDTQLGLGEPLEVSRFRFVTKRFGIEAGPPLADFTSGALSVEANPIGTCVVSPIPSTVKQLQKLSLYDLVCVAEIIEVLQYSLSIFGAPRAFSSAAPQSWRRFAVRQERSQAIHANS
jgi:hypothetical protein